MSPRALEKRSTERQRRRFQVQFEAKGIGGAGFTGNLSSTGMQLNSKFTSAPGSILRGHIFLPHGAQVDFEAEVRWLNKADGQLAQLFQSSMGLKFVFPPGEDYFALLMKAPATK